MATQIKVWEIANGKIVSRDSAAFSDSHREDELEEWITQSPDILGEKLLIIPRQLIIPEVGRLDILGMDENGKLVIIELKRDLGPREAVAQGLDYASWLSSASKEEVLAHANQYLQTQLGDTGRDLPLAFEETFGKSLPEWVCQNHKVILVAAGLDASAERIVNYLARKSVDINAVFFNYAELSDEQIIVRSVLVPESAMPPKAGKKAEWRIPEPVLLALANERKTTELSGYAVRCVMSGKSGMKARPEAHFVTGLQNGWSMASIYRENLIPLVQPANWIFGFEPIR